MNLSLNTNLLDLSKILDMKVGDMVSFKRGREAIGMLYDQATLIGDSVTEEDVLEGGYLAGTVSAKESFLMHTLQVFLLNNGTLVVYRPEICGVGISKVSGQKSGHVNLTDFPELRKGEYKISTFKRGKPKLTDQVSVLDLHLDGVDPIIKPANAIGCYELIVRTQYRDQDPVASGFAVFSFAESE